MIALCILLFALGHLVRDGYPATGSTQLARALGAAICGLGAFAVSSWSIALMVAGAILVGFYTDQKHAEGQRARGWTDVCYLLLSGVSSLVPLAGLEYYLRGDFYILVVGLLKPEVWFSAWRFIPVSWSPPAYPTRIAAFVFGATVGIAVAFGM